MKRPQQQFVRLLIGMVVATLVAALCYYAAFLLRFAGELDEPAKVTLLRTLPWVVALKVTIAGWFGLHLRWNRYATFADLLAVARAITFGSIGITLIDALLLPQTTIPRSVLLLDWGVALVAMSGLRAMPRLLREGSSRLFPSKDTTRALIVGANDAGEALLRAILNDPRRRYQVVGFVDNRQRWHQRRIAGVPVVGSTSQIATIAAQYSAEEVLITAGELPGLEVRRLIDSSASGNFRVKVLPSYEQLLDERVAIQPRPVVIGDLLRRPKVRLDTTHIRKWVGGHTVLVTGSAGSIGSEICRQLIRLQPGKLVLVDRSENGQFFLERELRRLVPDIEVEVLLADVTDTARVRTIFEQHQPHVVFHAAAYKHVPLCESHPGEAVKNIVLATRQLADLADEFATSSFVMISTDKAVNPTSVMGSCKRLAEQYVQAKSDASGCRFVTVRFGNVLDSAGSVVPIFREQIARGGPVTITHENMIRYFMMIPEAAQLVVQAGAMGQGGEIFVLDMGKPVRIVDLARDMIRLSGLREGDDIEIEVTGLRPGEKLYEELYGAGEEHQATSHPKIMVAASATRHLLEVIRDLRRLEEQVDEPTGIVRQTLGEIIPLHTAPLEAVPPPKRAA